MVAPNSTAIRPQPLVDRLEFLKEPHRMNKYTIAQMMVRISMDIMLSLATLFGNNTRKIKTEILENNSKSTALEVDLDRFQMR